jgi:hypothetical protein
MRHDVGIRTEVLSHGLLLNFQGLSNILVQGSGNWPVHINPNCQPQTSTDNMYIVTAPIVSQIV